MSAAFEDRQQRRQRLIALSTLQRGVMLERLGELRPPLQLIDRGIDGARYLRRHPQWLLLGAFVAWRLSPAQPLRWLRRGWIAWQGLRLITRQ